MTPARHRRVRVLALSLTVAALVAVVLSPPPALGPLVAVPFLVLVPATVVAQLLPAGPVGMRATVAIAAGLAFDVLVAEALLLGGVFSGEAVVIVVAVIATVGLMILPRTSIAPASQRPRAWSAAPIKMAPKARAIPRRRKRVDPADRLPELLEERAACPGSAAVVYLDIDGFVHDDDSNHDPCRRARRGLVDSLAGALRRSDTLARLDDGDFVVVAADVPDANEATALADRLRAAAASTPSAVEGMGVEPSVSMGISVVPADSGMPAMLRAFDRAMHEAKRGGRDCRCATPAGEVHEPVSLAESAMDALGEAVADGHVAVHYQPLVDVTTHELVGVEALARVRRGETLLDPTQSIHVAEEAGLIVSIGGAVVREACRQVAQWRDELGSAAPGRVAVNLTVGQLTHPRVVEMVRSALTESGLPHCLDIEVPEAAFVFGDGSAFRGIVGLRALGVRIGADDFDIAYASPAYLRNLPADFIKFDCAHVDRLADSKAEEAIVRSVVDLGHAVGMASTAVGVERSQQLRALQSAHCDLAQGALFSKPRPPRQLELALRGLPPSRGELQ